MEGVPKQSKKREAPLISRRNVLAWGGTAALAAVTAPSIVRQWPRAESDAVESVIEKEVVHEPAVEVVEQEPDTSEAFLLAVEKHRALLRLDRAAVFFTNEAGAIVGDVVPFEDFIEQRGTRTNKDGIEEPFFYKLTPAAKDEVSGEYVVDNVPPEWSGYVKARCAEEAGVSPDTLTLQHVTTEFVSAMQQDDEPELLAGIEAGTIRTRLDIARYFSEKDFAKSGGENRIEYIKQSVTFSGNLAKSTVMSEQLRELIPGLCAVESGFDNEVENRKTGAKASFQFLPDTWHKELGRKEFVKGEEVPFAEQVAAVGELFSKSYDRLQYWCYEEQGYQGRNYLEDIKALFPGQDDFEKFFLVPCLLNAHNTGEQGMGEVVVAYAQSKEFFARTKTAGVHGFDLFQEMTMWAATSELSQLQDYRGEASTYVQKIYAYSGLLSRGGESMQLAQLQ